MHKSYQAASLNPQVTALPQDLEHTVCRAKIGSLFTSLNLAAACQINRKLKLQMGTTETESAANWHAGLESEMEREKEEMLKGETKSHLAWIVAVKKRALVSGCLTSIWFPSTVPNPHLLRQPVKEHVTIYCSWNAGAKWLKEAVKEPLLISIKL